MDRLINIWRHLWLLLWLLLAPPAWAGSSSAALLVPDAVPRAQSLAAVLNSDGTLKSGASGSFDASGYRLLTAPDGKPVFRPLGTTGDGRWQDGFTLPGTNAAVLAVAQSGTDIYIGGLFTAVGNVPASRIAKWNGNTWSTLGTGLNHTVLTLAVQGGDLYVGGEFTQAGGIAANHVAKWNGSTWSALGAGVNNVVRALAPLGNDLYVGGEFTQAGVVAVNNIAKWDGSAWSALGAGLNSTIAGNAGPKGVHALAIIGTDLYAGGLFDQAGGAPANNIAKWNGNTWSTLSAGLSLDVSGDCAVFALAVQGSDLYVGGHFTEAGGISANSIAKWDGSTWSPLGAGVQRYATVHALVVSGTALYVGGLFNEAGRTPANNIAKWTGSGWSTLGAGMQYTVHALAVSGSSLYAGGVFNTTDGVTANYIAQWDGNAWSALGSGLNGSVMALAVSGGDLYVGGRFTTVGGIAANHIAKWNGSTWSPLGGGLISTSGNGGVFALAVKGTDVYAGGFFNQAGGVRAELMARWDGSTWHALDRGPGAYVDFVYAIAAIGNDLYVGGGRAGNTRRPTNIAKWNGSTWSALGLPGLLDGNVSALAVIGTTLYAGGDFTAVNGITANGIAKWDGSLWTALGSGISNTANAGEVSVSALAVSGNDLYVGGRFTTAGGVAASCVAKWNGSTWSALGAGLTGSIPTANGGIRDVYALVASGSDLYIGGLFTSVGGVPARSIAQWDGSTWIALGSGLAGPLSLDNSVYALAVHRGDVHAGGAFTTAGDGNKVTAYFATLQTSPNTARRRQNTAGNLTLSPNPSLASVTLRGAVAHAPVQIFAADGRLVLTRTADASGTARLRLPAHLPPGVYLVRCGAHTVRLLRE